MRLIVAAVGRLKRGPESELSERYAKRATQTGRSLGWREVEIVEIRESRAAEAGKRVIEESIALANIIPAGRGGRAARSARREYRQRRARDAALRNGAARTGRRRCS